MTSLGEKVRILRKERKLTQERLGKGIASASMISQIESNRALPSAHLLQELAHRLNVNPSYFQADSTVKSEEVSAYRRAKVLMDAKLYAQAILYLKPLVSAQSVHSLVPEADLYFDTALCYTKLERYNEAARVYEQSLSLFLTKQDLLNAIYAYYYLGHLHFRLNTLKLAHMFWQRAHALLRNHPHLNHPLTLKIYLGLARVQWKLKLHKLAEQNYYLGENLALQLKSWLDAAEIYEELGENYADQGSILEAEKFFRKAKDLYSTIHHQQGVLQSSLKLAIQLRLKGEYQSAVRQLKEILISLNASPVHPGDGSLKVKTYYELAACYTALGMTAQASETLSSNVLSLLEELPSGVTRGQWQIKFNWLQAELLKSENHFDDALEKLKEMVHQPYCQLDLSTLLAIKFFEKELYFRIQQRDQAIALATESARLLLKPWESVGQTKSAQQPVADLWSTNDVTG